MEQFRGSWGIDLIAAGNALYGTGEGLQYIATGEVIHKYIGVTLLLLAAGITIWNHWDHFSNLH